MKAKVVRGSDFRGILSYALNPRKTPEIIGGNMGGAAVGELTAEFAVVCRLRPSVTRPVWHCALSLPPGERLDSERWATVAEDFLARMDFPPDTPWIAVQHRDTPHDHIHIIASRISLSGGIWYGRWEVRKALQACQALERAHGLAITPGWDDLDPLRHRKNPSKSEIERCLRTGEAPARLALQGIIDQALEDGPVTLRAFVDRLKGAAVTVYPRTTPDGCLLGLVFQYDGIRFKGSQLGKGYTWKNLQRRGIRYDHDQSGKGSAVGERTHRSGPKGRAERSGSATGAHALFSRNDSAPSRSFTATDRSVSTERTGSAEPGALRRAGGRGGPEDPVRR